MPDTPGMDTPSKPAWRAAYLRRLHTITKDLEQLARMGRDVLPQHALTSVWMAQHALFQVVREERDDQGTDGAGEDHR